MTPIHVTIEQQLPVVRDNIAHKMQGETRRIAGPLSTLHGVDCIPEVREKANNPERDRE